MILSEAQAIADYWKEVFRPYCRKIEIAGSIRRQKPEVKDIELVCIPEEITTQDLFDNTVKHRSPAFIEVFHDHAHMGYLEILKGSPNVGKYVQVRLTTKGINLDMFIVKESNWGFQLAIRTGSGDYSHHVLGAAWVSRGYHGFQGHPFKESKMIETPDEREFFNLIGVPYTEPKDREYAYPQS